MKHEKGKEMSDMPEFMRVDEGLTGPQNLPDDSINSISKLAERIIESQNRISRIEEALKTDKVELRKLTDEELPAAMAEVNMKKFETDSGYSVAIKKIYVTNIKVEDRPEAFAWLRDNGHGDLIKNIVSINFGKGEDEVASRFKALAEEENIPVETDTKIHPMTLRAWGKEQIEKGNREALHEGINISVIDHAEIKGTK
tara:strand:+ start:495 stop:1091 length:597 start_codon:yes stop_codon:yes gene_type:complete